MRYLLITLLSVLVVAGVVACEDDQQQPEAEPTEQADEEIDEHGEEIEEPAAAEDEILEDIDDLALEGGKWLESELYDVKVRVPENWDIGESAEVVSANDPEGSTTALIAGSESDQTLQAAINDLKDDLEFTDVKLDSSEPTTLNGFPGHRGSGSAVLVKEDDIDTEIQFIGYALRVGSDKNATLMIFSEATMYEAMRDTIDGIAHTISRI